VPPREPSTAAGSGQLSSRTTQATLETVYH
jgi:hypothetical protein